jgi:hypothetical protein
VRARASALLLLHRQPPFTHLLTAGRAQTRSHTCTPARSPSHPPSHPPTHPTNQPTNQSTTNPPTRVSRPAPIMLRVQLVNAETGARTVAYCAPGVQPRQLDATRTPDADKWLVPDCRPFVDWLVGEDDAPGDDAVRGGARAFGAALRFVSDRTPEAQQLRVGLQGVAARLRFAFAGPEEYDAAGGSGAGLGDGGAGELAAAGPEDDVDYFF